MPSCGNSIFDNAWNTFEVKFYLLYWINWPSDIDLNIGYSKNPFNLFLMSRITAGIAKGTHLLVPDGITRPVTDRIKVSLFDTLDPVIKNSHVLDLYAGSGAIGLEALSRGAVKATFVESDFKAVELIKRNAERARLKENVDVFHCSIETFFAQNSKKFNLIFLDPPFPLSGEAKLSAVKQASDLLKEDGIIIFRFQKQEKYPEEIKEAGKTIKLLLSKRYGISVINFYKIA